MSRFPLRPPRRCSRLVIALLVAIGGLGWPPPTRAEVLPPASGLFSDAVLVEGTSWLALLEARWETPRRLTLADLDQRQPARVVALPPDRRRLAADPARQRLYATADTFSPVSPTVAIYDLGTGAVRIVPVAEPEQWLGPAVVNAATGRVYFPVWSRNARGRTVFAGTRVLDGAGRPVARLPVRVLAADPEANLLYAAEYLPSSTPEFYANEGLRLVVLDGRTEQRPPGSGERTYDRLTNVGATLLVHRRAQTLLLSISFYSAKAGHLPLQLLDGRALTPIPFTSGAPNIDLPFAVNEATNRAYGPTGAYQPAAPFIDSFDARTGALVARWHTNAGVLIAVDSQRNRLVLCRCAGGRAPW